LFHLYVMRKGAFLTGQGRSLYEDLRRIPRLLAGFATTPFTLVAAWTSTPTDKVESEAAL
jgi:hypothetical protein